MTDLPPGGTQADRQAKRTALINAAQQSGARWIRLTAYWAALQPNGTVFDATALDNLRANVQAARDAGLSVHLSLETTPAWAQECWRFNSANPFGPATVAGVAVGCGDPRYPPHDYNYNAWIAYLTDLERELGGQVQSWGIWNEPDSNEFFLVRAGRNRMDEYRKFLWYGTQELRDKGDLIVAPEVAQGQAGFDFLWYILDKEAARIDVVGVHQYNVADCTEKDMIRVGILASAKGKRVWITEGGYTGQTEAGHTREVAGLIDEMADNTANNGCKAAYDAVYPGEWRSGDASWERTFVYHLYASSPAEPTTNLGDLWGTSFTPKDSYRCLQWYATSAQGTPPTNCYR
jgi:hypothetical protein